MTDMTLYFAPDTCAMVTLIALEEIGYGYNLEVVAFMAGQHRSAEYLAINPKGKVPTLVVDGEALTENVAILLWLCERFPQAQLLPGPNAGWERAQQIADLAYCAAGLHPIVTRLRIPQFFCDTAQCIGRVFAMAEMAMHPNFALIDRRLANYRWWYGDRWSIMDAYINWIWFRVTGTDFHAATYANFARHNQDMMQRPAVARALSRSSEVAERLAAQGLAVRFRGPGAVSAPATVDGQ